MQRKKICIIGHHDERKEGKKERFRRPGHQQSGRLQPLETKQLSQVRKKERKKQPPQEEEYKAKCRENGTWRRSNFELYHSYKESDNVNFIKTQRIKWAVHVVRMDKNRTTNKVFNTLPTGTRRKGWPNLRWIDGLEKDLLVLRDKNW
ncbi:uncharacterized protein TNCV_533961 [Trichonephila clavipes]|nr:uncharacterized protein TNCV_533961 [Trichonephila clavipes]